MFLMNAHTHIRSARVTRFLSLSLTRDHPSLRHTHRPPSLQVWFQNARAKWRRSVLRQQSAVGPDVVKEPTPLSELSDLASVKNQQLDDDMTQEETEISQTGSEAYSPGDHSSSGDQFTILQHHPALQPQQRSSASYVSLSHWVPFSPYCS